MPRVPSDDESVASVRASLARSGGTRRLCVRVPNDEEIASKLDSGECDSLRSSAGDLVRLTIDRETYHARVERAGGRRLLRGAFDNKRLARTPGEGSNRLHEWIDDHGGEEGDVVLLDVLAPGDAYGLRFPGERTVYDVRRGPRSSLSDIANDLDG
ncbi:DUF7112 family protein [Halorubrum sp. DTA98]|uniref:DUF7112 family protein n=1 Tax=Halorubrum sp. DTA98 TaxID=3402163 RepID=UPI003AAEEC1C